MNATEVIPIRYLRHKTKGMSRRMLQNVANGMAWRSWWLSQLAQAGRTLAISAEFLSQDPFQDGQVPWPEAPDWLLSDLADGDRVG